MVIKFWLIVRICSILVRISSALMGITSQDTYRSNWITAVRIQFIPWRSLTVETYYYTIKMTNKILDSHNHLKTSNFVPHFSGFSLASSCHELKNLLDTPCNVLIFKLILLWNVHYNSSGKISQTSLLEQVMSRNQWHIGVHQHHLMFKGHWRVPHETIYGYKKKVCLNETFPLGHFILDFSLFLYMSNDYKS